MRTRQAHGNYARSNDHWQMSGKSLGKRVRLLRVSSFHAEGLLSLLRRLSGECKVWIASAGATLRSNSFRRAISALMSVTIGIPQFHPDWITVLSASRRPVAQHQRVPWSLRHIRALYCLTQSHLLYLIFHHQSKLLFRSQEHRIILDLPHTIISYSSWHLNWHGWGWAIWAECAHVL